MSNYSVLKQDINNNIYENQTQQITGTVLNAILNEMTASLGAGYQFAGVATLGMNPGDPDQRVFYLAGEGIYTSFGGIQVPAGKLGVLKWDNRWTLQTIDGLGGGGANLTGYVSVASTDDLPDEGVATLGYLCGTNLYLYVGEGGDTKEGKYQDCGSFRGPQGDSVQDVEQTQTSLENGGVNKIKFTLSNGISCEFQVRNGTTSSGLFPTVAALQAAYPSPVVGQYAFVGAGFPADIYVCTTAGTWTDSGEDYDGDNVDLTDYATKAEVNQLEAKVDDNTNDIDSLQNQLDNYQPIVIEGDVTNAPDEEDITTDENDLLKFANRAAHTNYLGYVILRKGKTFASQVTVPNTIYEIRYNFTLEDDELVTIPSGCELRFNGGSISGGVLNLNNALLSGDVNITSEPDMDETDEFVESYKPRNLVLPVSWFGAKGDGLADDAPAIQRTIKWSHKNGATIVFGNGTYILGDGISDDVTDTDKSKHTGYSYPADYPMLTNNWTGINDRQAFLEANPNDIGRNIVLDFFKFDNLRIEGNGATVKSHDNNGYVRNNGMFRFWNCKGLTVLDLTVDANREGRMDIYRSPYWGDLTIGPSFVNSDDLETAKSLASYLAQDVSWEAYGVIIPRGKVAGSRFLHSILLTNCTDTLFDGVNSVNGVVDGMSISSRDNKRITIKNGRIAHNQRHGIWLGLCNDVTVEKCVFEYAGIALDGETVMYMSGNTGGCSHIDCENESTTIMAKNNTIKNCHFGKTGKNGIVLSQSFQDSKVLNCTFVGSGIYSYRGRYCYNNEIAYCKLPYFGEAIHQEGMNFHHNTIDYEINDTLAKTLVLYSVNYSDSYVKGTESGLCSQTPSRFCNNIITIHYGSNIDANNRNTSVSFGIVDNIIMCDNVFANFDYSNTGGGGFNVKVRKFKGNTFTYDTVKYPWLANNINKLVANGFSYRMQDIEIANPQINRLAYDVERRSSEVIVRICRTYSEATRYLIIKNGLLNGTIKVSGTGVDISAPQYCREYFIHSGRSTTGQDFTIWYRDIFTTTPNYTGGLRSNFNGVYELDTKVTLASQPYYIEIHIPFVGSTQFAEDLISFQSTQYAFTGTVRTATDISAIQDAVPTLNSNHRGQFNGATVYDKTLGKLLVKNDTGFVDVNGHPAAKSVGATADRPTASAVGAGFTYFDTDLGKMIVSNGTAWVNMDGTALS